MFGKRMPLFRIAGLDIRLDPSWTLLLILVCWSLALGYFPANYPKLSSFTWWMMGIVGAVGLVASILIHEISHSLMARRYGISIRGITLFLFGGMAELGSEPERPRHEFAMAIVGPVVSAIIGIVCGTIGTWGASV